MSLRSMWGTRGLQRPGRAQTIPFAANRRIGFARQTDCYRLRRPAFTAPGFHASQNDPRKPVRVACRCRSLHRPHPGDERAFRARSPDPRMGERVRLGPHVHFDGRLGDAHGDGDRLPGRGHGARPLRRANDIRHGNFPDRDRRVPDRGHVGRLALHRRVRADRRDRLLDRFRPADRRDGRALFRRPARTCHRHSDPRARPGGSSC